MGGYEKAKQVADKLKGEQLTEEEHEVAVKAEVKQQLVALKDNPILAKMYQDNAQVGAENLAGELPLLKVHSVGKSTKNELADGTEPTDGYFFFKPTSEQFQTLTCHILTISRGYKAEGMDGAAPKFNQILGGLIVENGEYKPFIMYFTGVKLSNLWEFGKEASRYTKARPIAIPMFALTVNLHTEKIKTNFGSSWVVKFEIEKNEDATPKLVLDAGEFQFLKDSVETVQETIDQLVETKMIREEEPEAEQYTRTDVIDGELSATEDIQI